MDNMIMMRSVIDNNRRLSRITYCYFADAFQCFDKLWLKDCLVELWRGGMRETEVDVLYEINKESNIVIETPVGMTDAFQCFDKWWLKDCLVELWRAGMREREVYMLYEMNKGSNIVIETPVGMTDSITVHETVKQGTIFGPKLCIVATEKINVIGDEISTHITPELNILFFYFIDFIHIIRT